jgi:hypothetical protein
VTGTLAPRKLAGHERMRWFLNEVDLLTCGADLVVIEGPSYGSAYAGQKGHHERAGLWWLVTHNLWAQSVPVAIAPPAVLKKYATGKGNANKDLVLTDTVRRFADFQGGNDAADALVLCAIGADHMGLPLVAMPKVHRDALAKVAWPAVLTPALVDDPRSDTWSPEHYLPEVGVA